jgi:hypothetical protein
MISELMTPTFGPSRAESRSFLFKNKYQFAMQEGNTRDILWIKIEKALNTEGCPICSIIKTSTEHYLENLLYEYVLDVSLREKLHKSFGFCQRHAYLATKIRERLNDDGLKIAILYETITSDEIGRLKDLEKIFISERKKFSVKRSLKKGKFVENFKPRGECPACFQERMTESLYIDDFRARSNEKEFRELYGRDAVILCRGHFVMLLENCLRFNALDEFDFFLKMQIEKLEKILKALTSFIDKHDYRKRESINEFEARSWRFVVEYFSGKKDVKSRWDEV